MGKLSTNIVAAALLMVMPLQATATPYYSDKKTVTIRGDRGGVLIKYALKMKKMEQRGTFVRFAGHCDSACTLYLALPRSRVCITKGAKFRFHMPYGSSAKNNRTAANYMMRNYPGWVRSWIRKNGGLTSRLKTMNYGYASRYLPACSKGKSGPKRTRTILAFLTNRGR